jgi:hypothetical protein
MANGVTNLLWTGGWDSTFRLLDLLLIRRKPVQTFYVIDWERPSTATEIRTMSQIKRLLFKKHPHTRDLLRPTQFCHRADLEENEVITRHYDDILRRYPLLGSQYEWLARFAEERGIEDLELCILRDGFIRTILGPQLSQSTGGKEDAFPRVDERARGSSEYALFHAYAFPLLHLSKTEMERIAADSGFGEILERTWFCHRPTGRGKPCGLCSPCGFVIRDGLGRRVPLVGRLKYRAKRLLMVNQIKASLKRRPAVRRTILALRARIRDRGMS